MDFIVRSAGYSNLYPSSVLSLPFVQDAKLDKIMGGLFLRLNALTDAYAPLWRQMTGEEWQYDTPFRKAIDRYQAQNEIDAIMAHKLGLTSSDLVALYETQFPVQKRADNRIVLDANGRQVPPEVLKRSGSITGAELSSSDRTWVHPQSGTTYVFELPFREMNRSADLEKAWLKFAEA